MLLKEEFKTKQESMLENSGTILWRKFFLTPY